MQHAGVVSCAVQGAAHRRVAREGRDDAAQEERDALVVELLLELPGLVPPAARHLGQVAGHLCEELVRVGVALQHARDLEGWVRHPVRRSDGRGFEGGVRVEALAALEEAGGLDDWGESEEKQASRHSLQKRRFTGKIEWLVSREEMRGALRLN